jgi:hypothetical protein
MPDYALRRGNVKRSMACYTLSGVL